MAASAFQLAEQALCSALDALGEQTKAVILVGAQAVYQHTSHFEMPVAPFTTDADLLLDSSRLSLNPAIDKSLLLAGFTPSENNDAVGSWVSVTGVPVDLMMATSQAGPGRRSARVGGHGERTIRKTKGLESALHDHQRFSISCSDEVGPSHEIAVASPAALIVAKLHKISDRLSSDRLLAKDAYDVYRLLFAVEAESLAKTMTQLRSSPEPKTEVEFAIGILAKHFASSPTALGPTLAGLAESTVGDPEQVQNRVWALSRDLLDELG